MQKVSNELFKKAKILMPGGVNSPVRAFGAVDGDPIFFDRAKGASFTDVDGKDYIDYCMSWGPLILGHAHPEVISEVQSVAAKGLSFGAPNIYEVKLAEKVLSSFCSMDRVRFVSSGTEAVMSAVRVARAYTKREKIVKFDGGYHGHADSFLVSAGSGLKTFGTPSSPGVNASVARETVVLKFNETEQFREFMSEQGSSVAAVVVEPLPGNSGLNPLSDEFLYALRQETKDHGALLICDEVISGFRTCYGSYAERRDISPDMITLGKIIGGGLPVGAYLGKKEFMDLVSPEGPVYQAGTLSGNPVSMAAGLKTLELLEKPGFYEQLEENSALFEVGLRDLFEKKSMPYQLFREGSLIWFYLSEQSPFSSEAEDSDLAVQRFREFHRALLEEGVYLPPSAWEILFLSTFHDKSLIAETIARMERALEKVSR